MKILCKDCSKSIKLDLREDSWFRLSNLLTFLWTQGILTNETFESALGDLGQFRNDALADRDAYEEYLNNRAPKL